MAHILIRPGCHIEQTGLFDDLTGSGLPFNLGAEGKGLYRPQ